jgi:hypothetical protein
MRSWSWALVSAALWAGAAWCTPPGRVELAYEISRNGLTIAEVLWVLEHDGRSYRITETGKGRGILALRGATRRSSHGTISPHGLRPRQFIDERSGRSRARADFDWRLKTVTMQYKGEPRTEPLPPHAHDRLAFLFDFAFAPSGRSEAAFDLFDGRGQSHHLYTADGRAPLKTPAGEFQALRFVRAKGRERTELWLARELGDLPVRIVVSEEDGTRYEQVATKIALP